MDLIERYLHAVKSHLPAAQQDDVVAELAEDLRSRIEERESELNRPLEESEVVAVLKTLGHPAHLAASYGSWQQLIGPALFPMTLRAVFDVSRAVPDTPVIAVGGIRTGEDAVEAFLAGAWAVQVGTATLIDPAAPVSVAQGIVRYLKAKGLATPADVRSRLRVPASFGAASDAEEDRR